MAKPKPQPALLTGWQAIASFLGLPISTVRRWAKFGMPVSREGRRVQASPEELNRWLGREVSEPVRIANEGTDLGAELKRGLSYVRKQRRTKAA
jgi:phage terminase Nu1 subunit (DNA packaging protein)